MNKPKEEEKKPMFTGTISVIKSPLMDKLFGATEAVQEAGKFGIKLKGEKLDDCP